MLQASLVVQVSTGTLRLPPPPPGMTKLQNLPGKPTDPTERNAMGIQEAPKMIPPPPPPPKPPVALPGQPVAPSLQPDVLPPGISRLPPPAPDMVPSQLPVPGVPHNMPPLPPGVMGMHLPRPPFGPPPGPPPSMFRPPLPPGPPPFAEDDMTSLKPSVLPPKPSYVKSAASTVVKRPLAQHTPELTAMVSLVTFLLC